MQKSVLLRALQQEIRRHDFNYFVEEPTIWRTTYYPRRMYICSWKEGGRFCQF